MWTQKIWVRTTFCVGGGHIHSIFLFSIKYLCPCGQTEASCHLLNPTVRLSWEHSAPNLQQPVTPSAKPHDLRGSLSVQSEAGSGAGARG